MADRKLTPKQAAFVQEYLIDLNATQAAIRAGYSKKTADKQGTQLLGKTRIAAAIQNAMKKRATRTEITQDKVLEEIAAIAFANGSDFAQIRTTKHINIDTGEEDCQVVEFKDTETLDKKTKAAIAQIKQGKFGPEVIPCDKLKALELLGKHLGMWEKPEQKEEEPPDDGFLDALKEEAGEVWEKD